MIDMSLGGFVSCRCWQDGVTTPPSALAEHIGFRDGAVGLLLPWPEWLTKYREVDDWKATACPHPNMDYVKRWVCNWPRRRLFETALGTAGWEHFPTLSGELPEYDHLGTMPATSAPRMLAELAYFFTDARLGERLVLIEEHSGVEVCEYIPEYDGVWRVGSGYHVGIDPDGFFVDEVEHQPGEEVLDQPSRTVFRSHRFKQRLHDGAVELTDATQSVRLPIDPICAEPEQVSEYLCTERRPRLADEFRPMVEALEALCRGSIETGNPVVWI